ncbi:MAG: hypothetical protein KatS3mg102_0426 [Planctomycetota bacterium]|nr:MAG: hypothetical protein KatS3mg102_0426 [Planctomycetota bacterium]
MRTTTRRTACVLGAALACLGSAVTSPPAAGQSEAERGTAERALREELEQLRRRTDERIGELERELEAMRAERERAAAAEELERLRAAAEEQAREPAPPPEAAQPGLFGRVQQVLNALNPRITVFGDAAAPLELSGHETELDDRFSVREVELDFRAAVDPYASGVLILAAEEEEPGEYHLDVEEAYLTLDTLPWRLHAQIGRFLPAIGFVNRLHTHDLPWTIRPLPNQDFIGGEEGWRENGVRLSWLAPALGPLTVELSGWVLNGENPVVLAGAASDDPAWMGRVEATLEFGPGHFLSAGSNLLFGYNDEDARRKSRLLTGDAIYKYQPNQWFSTVLFGEAYYLEKEVAGGTEYGFGAWVGAQLQPALGRLWAPLQHTYLGVRYDFSNYDEQTEDAEQWALAGYLSWYTTEFLRFRIGYEHRERESTGGLGRPDEQRVMLQVTLVFGSHPVEPFWFNR